MEKKNFISPLEVAELLTVSMPTIYRLISNKIIPSHRFGGSLKISKEDLEKFIRESRVE